MTCNTEMLINSQDRNQRELYLLYSCRGKSHRSKYINKNQSCPLSFTFIYLQSSIMIIVLTITSNFVRVSFHLLK